MDENQPDHSVSIAGLMADAVAASRPDLKSHSSSPALDSLPQDNPFGLLEDPLHLNAEQVRSGQVPGLHAAFNEGYEPLLCLGRGASSVVWRCVDRSLATREVAIKFPVFEAGQHATHVGQAIANEAALLGKLDHPGIVRAIRRSGGDESAYLVMDFIEGENILEHAHLLSLDAKERLELFVKVLDAVSYLHSEGIVHGDLKPEHILLKEDGQPVIVDFGLSSDHIRERFKVDHTSRVGGSGSYRSPEIVDQSASCPDSRQDVYSLGVILRQLLRDVEAQPWADDLGVLGDRATHRDPAMRWEDGGAMLHALAAVLTDDASGRITSIDAESPRHRGPALSKPYLALLVAGVVGVLALIPLLAPSKPQVTEREHVGSEQAPRSVVQASVFDLALGHIQDGKPEKAQELLNEIGGPDGQQARPWEARHLEAMIKGEGVRYPFGEEAYEAPRALCADFDPTTGSIAFIKKGQDSYETWIRSAGSEARLIGNATGLVIAIAISPGAERVATIDQTGQVIVHPINKDADTVGHGSITLPRQQNDRILWFGPDGQTLFLFSPSKRVVEAWQVSDPLASEPAFVIEHCDHAYPLPSGEGAFLVATAGQNTDNGKTRLRLIAPDGAELRALNLTDGQLPASADTTPTQDGVVCLGMPDGFVRINDPQNDGWQPPCDLGVNSAVPAIAYAAEDKRVFAALGRVHVIDTEGTLVRRLGNRDSRQQLITSLHVDQPSSTLTGVSKEGVWQCLTE